MIHHPLADTSPGDVKELNSSKLSIITLRPKIDELSDESDRII